MTEQSAPARKEEALPSPSPAAMASSSSGGPPGEREPNRSSSTGGTTPLPPTINRRSSTPLPGLSSTASSIRNRRTSNAPARSSLHRVHSQRSDGAADDDDDDDGSSADGDRKQLKSKSELEELRKGIIMPGMGGNRANTEGASSSSSSNPNNKRPDEASRKSQPLPAASSTLQQAAQRDLATRQQGLGTAAQQGRDGANPALARARLPVTLKASMLKGRHQAATQASAGGAKVISNKSTGNAAKGTPARATRYSLPVRAEKPVRTSKTSGKHVMLPSESQLAPLPDEEEDDDEDDEDDDDDDDDDDDEEESSEESDTEEGKDADDEDQSKEANEEERLKDREEAKKRREEAQRSMEKRREEKATQKLARKPAGVPGYPSTARFRGITSSVPTHPLPPLKGPAHARAPPRKPKASGPAYHTFERLAPSSRVHTPLPRLTSYAISPSIHLPTLIGFLRREHGVRPRLYDECVYVVYFKPLLPGFGRAEVRSAPEPAGASPGGESRREREIVAREESGYVGGYFAATNKDDEGDHIDHQGYIMGGEGEGEGSESRNRDRQGDRNGGGGDVTETETEREGPEGKRYGEEEGRTSAAEASESEAEMALLGGASKTSARDLEALTSEAEDELDSGMMTPRALEPRRELGDDLDLVVEEEEEEEEEQRRSAGMEQSYEDPVDDNTIIVEEQQLSKADVQGAMDLQHQQHMIESGQTEDGMFTAARQPSPVMHYNDGGMDGNDDRRASPENNGGTRRQRGERRSRRQRDKPRRKARKETMPNTASHNHDTSTNMLTSRSVLEALQVAELIILPYGVLVMYNLSAAEERSIINDVLSSGCVRGGLPYSPDDEETEAFHFCYDPTVPAPRIFNDFFTFRSSNHLLKLSLAHAIAQSTKLSVFEESMQQTLELTSHIPRELASSGELKLKRREALKLTGRLFKLRVDVNLTSNVLDTPELFWSEASLKALYDAIREYLEIDQRVENLNERLAVGNDLLEVIHDHIGSQAMNQITWIIIILIVVACIVACGEITARLVLHASQRRRNDLALDPDFQLLRRLYYLSSSSHSGSSSTVNAASQLLLN